MEDRTCKTCRYNDNLLCDKKGVWIRDNHTCSKWQQERDWRQSMMAKFLKTR